MHKVDITVVQSYPFLVDINSTTDTDYRGYLARENGVNGTFNIGRTSDTGPGYVDNEVVNPPAGVIDSIAFPPQSEVNYQSQDDFTQILVKLSGAEERRKERIGAFYVKGVDTNGEFVKITTIKTASEGKDYRAALTGYCFPNQKLGYFVCYLKIINTFLKNNICILE